MTTETSFYNLKGVPSLTQSLAMQIAREIGRNIVSGNYKEWELLEDEASLSLRYRVSRTALRDAIKILSGKGLIETRRGIGTRVLPRNHWALLDNDVLAWHQSIVPTKKLMFQFLDVRKALEPKAAYWAAERTTEEDCRKIRDAYDGMAKELDPKLYITSDALFHRTILRATKNDFLVSFEGIIFSALLMSIRLTNKDYESNEASLKSHYAVYEAIKNHDKDLAKNNMDKLLDEAEQKLILAFEGKGDLEK